jgi:hypothetical protein
VHKGVCTQLATYIRQMRADTVADIRARSLNGRDLDSFHEGRAVFVVHCVCHRLALVSTDAIKGTAHCDKVIPEEVVELLNMLHSYFARSPARKREMSSYIPTENRTRVERQRQVQAEGRRAPRVVAAENPVPVLERILGVLEELHKLPKKIIMTRWLSCAG